MSKNVVGLYLAGLILVAWICITGMFAGDFYRFLRRRIFLYRLHRRLRLDRRHAWLNVHPYDRESL